MLIGSLMAKLGLDDSEYRRKLGAAPGAAAMTLGQVGTAVGGMGSQFVSALTAPIHMVERLIGSIFNLRNMIAGSIIGVALKKMLDPAIAQIQTTTQLVATIGNTGLAKRLADLADVRALKGVFSGEAYAGGIRALYNMAGAAFLTGKNIKMLEDLAAGAGQSFEFVSRMVGRVYSSIQQGSPAAGQLGRLVRMQMIDQSVVNQVKKMEEMKKPWTEIWEVIEKGLGKFKGAFYIMADTPQAKLNALKEQISETFETLGLQILPHLMPMLQKLIDWIDKLRTSGKLEQWGANIATAIDWAKDAVVRLFNAIRENWSLIMQVMKWITIAYLAKTIGGAILGLVSNLAMLGMSAVVTTFCFGSLAITMGLTLGAALLLVGVFAACAAAVVWSAVQIFKHWGDIAGLFGRTGTAADAHANSWMDSFVKILNGMNMLWLGMSAAGKAIVDLFANVATNMVTLFLNAFENVGDIFRRWIGQNWWDADFALKIANEKETLGERLLKGMIPVGGEFAKAGEKLVNDLAGPLWGDKLKEKLKSMGLDGGIMAGIQKWIDEQVAKFKLDAAANLAKDKDSLIPNIDRPIPGKTEPTPKERELIERQYAPVAVRGSKEAFDIQNTRFDTIISLLGNIAANTELSASELEELGNVPDF